MIFNPNEDYSLFPKPSDLEEATAVPIVFPSLRRQCKRESKSRVTLQFIVPKDAESISIFIPVQIARELGSKIETCYLWRDQAMDEHAEEPYDFLVMFRYVGTVELKDGEIFQFLDLGVEPNGNFSMRLARSEVGSSSPDYTSFLQVMFYDAHGSLLQLGRQIEFVCSLIEDSDA